MGGPCLFTRPRQRTHENSRVVRYTELSVAIPITKSLVNTEIRNSNFLKKFLGRAPEPDDDD